MFKSAFIVWKLVNHRYYHKRLLFTTSSSSLRNMSSETRGVVPTNEEESTTSNEKLVIIDTDAGFDDALAILVALDNNSKRNAETKVLALTSVFGNTSSDQAALNLRRIVAMNYYENLSTVKGATENDGKAAPISSIIIPKIYKGASQPIMSPQPPPSWVGHGSNGLGGWKGGNESSKSLEDYVPLQQEHAVNAMIRLVQENPPDTIDLIAIGPLTNVALACKLDPTFLKKLKRIHIMGGSLYAKGNASRSSEFNFWCDPEAANIVLGQHGICDTDTTKIVLVPWETTVDAGVTWEYYDTLSSYDSKRSNFLKLICQHGYEKFVRYAPPKTSTSKKAMSDVQPDFIACDVLAVIALMYPEETIIDAIEAHVNVETAGQHSRGMLAIDWYGTHHGNDPRITIIRKMNSKVLWKIVQDILFQQP